jgi:hypothetical protein
MFDQDLIKRLSGAFLAGIGIAALMLALQRLGFLVIP